MKNLLGDVMRGSFEQWGKTGRLKAQYKKMGQEACDVVAVALDELEAYKPGLFQTWWISEHIRFSLTGVQQRLMHELVYGFLTDYCHGRLARTEARKAKRSDKK